MCRFVGTNIERKNLGNKNNINSFQCLLYDPEKNGKGISKEKAGTVSLSEYPGEKVLQFAIVINHEVMLLQEAFTGLVSG